MNSEAKATIQAIDRDALLTPSPLIGIQDTFKNAADIDSSGSPIDPNVLDELGSTDSDGDVDLK
jgi:hypothetical protein